MPTLLVNNQKRLQARLNTLDGAFERHVRGRSSKKRIDRFAVQEGLVSTLWQAWCVFCRATIIDSVIGASTIRGAVTTSSYSHLTEPEVTFVAKQFSQGSVVKKIKPLSGSHLEPTWGDPLKLNLMIVGLRPSNHSDLATAFGSALTLLDLQMCRNASAHLNYERLRDISSARVRYLETDFSHPSDMMIWLDPTTNDYIWKSWIDEMNLISLISVQ